MFEGNELFSFSFPANLLLLLKCFENCNFRNEEAGIEGKAEMQRDLVGNQVIFKGSKSSARSIDLLLYIFQEGLFPDQLYSLFLYQLFYLAFQKLLHHS